MKDIYQVIKKVRISEKATMLQETTGELVFEVDRDANKIEIKNAIEEIFKVTVVNVNTVNVHGKMKRMGRTQGMTASWKKAVVTLREGDSIEVFEGL